MALAGHVITLPASFGGELVGPPVFETFKSQICISRKYASSNVSMVLREVLLAL